MSWLYGALRDVPSIYNVQEIYPDYLVNQAVLGDGALLKLLRKVESFVYTHNRFFVAISEEFAALLRERGVSQDRLRVIPNFVDTALFRPLPRRNAFALRHQLVGASVVLYGGNIGLSQDWESVLEAAELLRDERLIFVLVGDGVRREWLQQEVTRRGLPNVRILGHQPREAMPEIHTSSDLQIIPLKPTTALDTLPSKIYAVMACGKPMIVSAESSSAVAELVRRAGCGKVVNPGEPRCLAQAIREALADPVRLAGAGERGRAFVTQHHSQTRAGQAYDDVIRKLLNSRSESAAKLSPEAP